MSFTTPFEKNNEQSATYEEAIRFYRDLDARYSNARLIEFGHSDVGRPLHVFVIDNSRQFDPLKSREEGKLVMLVNNGIHPGEPCGIDASMMWARDLLENDPALLEKVTLLIIPVYNIGGALNRSSYSRANQRGPEAYGFRGNARNLDLNRDFIKCDSRNARAFNRLVSRWKPDVFADTHTSNGADYAHTMTLITTQTDKLGGALGKFADKVFVPQLYREMEQKGWDMVPYVYTRDVREGIYGFMDSPRYSSGYTTLHHTLGFIPETHMLKPFAERVRSTYDLLQIMLEAAAAQREQIQRAKELSLKSYLEAVKVPIEWQRDTSRKQEVSFKGYEPGQKKSELSGQDRLYYDRKKSWEAKVPFHAYYKPLIEVVKPKAYILPQAYVEVAERLSWNGVKMERLERDTVMEVEMYYIEDYETTDHAYEGHYLHSNVKLSPVNRKHRYFRGDYYIPTDQEAVRYIVETLEPQAPDSYFAWNFFDGILMQKEHFSSYVFEDTAAELLRKDPELRKALEEKKASDPEFAKDARAQLDFVYKRSPYYEQTHRLYPVGRVIEN